MLGWLAGRPLGEGFFPRVGSFQNLEVLRAGKPPLSHTHMGSTASDLVVLKRLPRRRRVS
jgi:hypothetical protein